MHRLDIDEEDVVFLNQARASTTSTDPRSMTEEPFIQPSSPSSSQQCRPHKKEKIFFIVCTLLCFFCLLLGLLYVREITKHRDDSNCSKSPEICTSLGCLQAAQAMLSSMDHKTEPCTDFYQYACGGWIEKNEIPSSKGSWTQIMSLQEKTRWTIKNLLESREKQQQNKDNVAVQKAFRLYKSCNDENTINEHKAQPLKEIIQSLGSSPLFDSSWSDENWSVHDTFVKLRQLGISTWFQLSVGVDINNSTRYGIMLDQAGTGLKTNVYWTQNSSYYEKIRVGYKKQMIKFSKLLGANDETVSTYVDEIYALEDKLARVSIRDASFNLRKLTFKRMTIAKVMEETGGQIDFLNIIHQVFDPIGYQITNQTRIAVFSLSYIKKMAKIFSQTPNRVKANYMTMMAIRRFGRYLHREFRSIYLELQKVGSGTAVESPRWETCVRYTSASLRMAVALLFVDETFQGDSKIEAERIVNEIKNVLIEKLKNVDWMDQKTKQSAIEKAEAIVEDIGYPDYIKNSTKLSEEYEFEVGDDFFWNMIRISNYTVNKNFMNILYPVNRKQWVVSPATVNAFYSPPVNKIMFPAGILQAPFYNKAFPKSLNYGGIGMVIAHEITHGFDTLGRQFDKNGNLFDWWSNASSKAFLEKAECLTEQYSQYKLFGMKINGTKTVRENIADNGAIKLTHQAYMNWKKTQAEEEPGLPGIDLTQDQLFFVNFAQVWCSKWRPSMVKTQLTYAMHTPDQFRVMGSMSNFPEFSKAFHCRADAPMNPKKRCSVW